VDTNGVKIFASPQKQIKDNQIPDFAGSKHCRRRPRTFDHSTARLIVKTERRNSRESVERITLDECGYPTGMVWCPMKMSGIAVMKCAELQKQLGCGSLREFRITANRKPDSPPFFWPWLRRRRECPERASEREVRELRLALSPLKPVDKSRKNPRAYRCSSCGGCKAFAARQCRRCWRLCGRG
jgi:hypothetical protein